MKALGLPSPQSTMNGRVISEVILLLACWVHVLNKATICSVGSLLKCQRVEQ